MTPLVQSTLFGTGDVVLFEDEECGIRYRPAVIDDAMSRDWFAALERDVPWRALQREMYDRMVAVPRLIGSYALDAPDLPPEIAKAHAVVARYVEAAFDSVGLNLYRDGNDSVAPHNDTLHALMPGQPIALLSLGATRDMVIAPKPGVAGRRIRLPLESGSLLVMSHASQTTHEHGVPKTRHPVGPRISMAFRSRQPGGDLLRGYVPAK